MSSYYQHHVFFCLNQRDDGSACCADHNAKAMQEYAKNAARSLVSPVAKAACASTRPAA
jgi:hypothetical protein